MSIRQQVQEMLRGRYKDDAIENAVLDDAEKNGTLERIAEGELTLPSRHDAIHWHERVTGVKKLTPTEAAQQDLIAKLTDRLAAMEQRLGAPNTPPDFAAMQQLTDNPPPQSEAH